MAGDYRPSRTLDPANAPQEIHWAVINGNQAAVVDELLAAIRASVAERDVPDAVMQMKALLGRVEQCSALDPDDVVNISRDRSLWELRLDDASFDLHVRIYCTELPELPHLIVALHAHLKDVSGTDDEIRDAQDAAIDLASRRWIQGRQNRWGLP